MNITQYFSRFLPQLSKCVVFWYNYFSRIDSTMFQPNSSRHQDDQHALNCSTSFDQEKNLIFGASVTQPPPINTTAPELTALLIHLSLLLIYNNKVYFFLSRN